LMVAHRVEPEHGTRARYVHRSLGCRCLACREANRAYIARYRHDMRIIHAHRSWQQPSLPGVGDR
jgi:hypothetical protein